MGSPQKQKGQEVVGPGPVQARAEDLVEHPQSIALQGQAPAVLGAQEAPGQLRQRRRPKEGPQQPWVLGDLE